MDCYSHRPKRRRSFGGGWRLRRPPKCGALIAMFVYGIAGLLCLIQSVTCQQHSLVNTPPILYVPDRNWRIAESEEVGQIITRIRAEDPENDELVFGLEPHFLSNYADPSANDAHAQQHKLPFRIDPARGIVYLNESLVGRGGENFFLYITVSDGVLTAKNEVFVNILTKDNDKSSSYREPPSITSVVQNISQILPPFGTLPGVQSIRNQRPSNHLPPNFGYNPSLVRPNLPNVANNGDGHPISSIYNYHPSQTMWAVDNSNSGSAEYDNDITTQQSIEATHQTATTGRIKLTPVGNNNSVYNRNISMIDKTQNTSSMHNQNRIGNNHNYNTQDAVSVNSTLENLSTAYPINPTMILVIFAICGLVVAASVVFGFLYRKHLCAISKKLKKKSKEEMVKKSNQSNLSSNLTDDSRNSMVMQHWNGPIAYSNRYVPWERDQQQLTPTGLTTSQLSTSAMNGVMVCGDSTAAGNMGGPPNTGNGADMTVAGNTANSGNGMGENRDNGNGSRGQYDRWEFPRHRLKFFNILGEGAFGQVWRCEAIDIDGIEGVSTVAVKTLKENTTEIEKRDLMSELDVMKSLEPNMNVVRLLGCCTDKDPMFVIIEYVNHGKLQTYLRNSRAERHYGNTHGKSNILTSGDLTSFMYQVAKGMDYLTSRGIIHRDLAARNILIADDHTCKVADFGFARDVVTSKIYERKSEGKLPIRWMAIESLYDNIFSVKSDIWSFGILMWEIVTLGSTPYPGISAADVMRKVRDGYRLEKPEHCRRELYNIMYYCWANDANERPTFAELVQMLDKLLHTEMDYIELERFPDHNYYNILNLSGEKL